MKLILIFSLLLMGCSFNNKYKANDCIVDLNTFTYPKFYIKIVGVNESSYVYLGCLKYGNEKCVFDLGPTTLDIKIFENSNSKNSIILCDVI